MLEADARLTGAFGPLINYDTSLREREIFTAGSGQIITFLKFNIASDNTFVGVLVRDSSGNEKSFDLSNKLALNQIKPSARSAEVYFLPDDPITNLYVVWNYDDIVCYVKLYFKSGRKWDTEQCPQVLRGWTGIDTHFDENDELTSVIVGKQLGNGLYSIGFGCEETTYPINTAKVKNFFHSILDKSKELKNKCAIIDKKLESVMGIDVERFHKGLSLNNAKKRAATFDDKRIQKYKCDKKVEVSISKKDLELSTVFENGIKQCEAEIDQKNKRLGELVEELKHRYSEIENFISTQESTKNTIKSTFGNLHENFTTLTNNLQKATISSYYAASTNTSSISKLVQSKIEFDQAVDEAEASQNSLKRMMDDCDQAYLNGLNAYRRAKDELDTYFLVPFYNIFLYCKVNECADTLREVEESRKEALLHYKEATEKARCLIESLNRIEVEIKSQIMKSINDRDNLKLIDIQNRSIYIRSCVKCLEQLSSDYFSLASLMRLSTMNFHNVYKTMNSRNDSTWENFLTDYDINQTNLKLIEYYRMALEATKKPVSYVETIKTVCSNRRDFTIVKESTIHVKDWLISNGKGYTSILLENNKASEAYIYQVVIDFGGGYHKEFSIPVEFENGTMNEEAMKRELQTRILENIHSNPKLFSLYCLN